LTSQSGETLSSNLYWEGAKTPPDFSTLSEYEKAKLDLSYTAKQMDGETCVYVRVKNPTNVLSIMNRLAIVKTRGNEEVLPTFWGDNFFALFPGEEKTIEARFADRDLDGSPFSVVIDQNR
jgi:hypothetical protein